MGVEGGMERNIEWAFRVLGQQCLEFYGQQCLESYDRTSRVLGHGVQNLDF